MCDEYILVGRRSLLCGEITKAVENFQKACELIAAEHGDLDERLAEPNLLYGTALLELARMEGPVLGNALDGVPEDDDSDENELIEKGPEMTAVEKADLSNQVIDAMCEESKDGTDKQSDVDRFVEGEKSGSEAVTADEEEATADNEEETETDSREEAAAEDEAVEGAEDADQHGDDEAIPGNEEEAGSDVESEDVSNLQLAWEVIEVAKRIFSKSDSNEHRLKVADCFEKLAEISREKEDYEQAIIDLQECMNIRSSLLDSESREVAETHFQIGTTHAVSGKLESASIAFHASLSCLKQYSEKVKVKLEEANEEEEMESLRLTLKDVEELIPDVERRCVEVEEDRLASVTETKISPPKVVIKANVAPGDDISHLIRKKRPVTDGNEATEAAEVKSVSESNESQSAPRNKKAKLEGNGALEVKANGDAINGVSKVETVSH